MSFYEMNLEISAARLIAEIFLDGRTKKVRELRRRNNELWAEVTDEELVDYAKRTSERLGEKLPVIGFDEWLRLGKLVRAASRQILEDSRRW